MDEEQFTNAINAVIADAQTTGLPMASIISALELKLYALKEEEAEE